MDQVNKQALVVPMRFYANWDVDRTSSSAIQRTLSMIFTRLVLTKTLSTDMSLIIAVRMQGTRRRTLRSNDITISPSSLDISLDISFTIQYCHFIKRKSNNLQILIQRRKKYKNRQIPGFKTLAVGHINLDEILQQGGSREVPVWDTTCLNKSGPSVKELHAGTIFIANCFTQVVDANEQDVHKWNKSLISKGDSIVLMSEEENDDYSSPDDSDFDDFDRSARRPGEDNTSSRKRQQINSRQNRKKIKQKNIKQKVVALLRRFRIPDEEDNAATTAPGSTTSSRVLPPTELELQEIFEELENISDSGPELEPDKMSIVSNPRPGIRPFFAEGSKTDGLPAIEDQLHSDDSVESEEQEMSSEDNLKDSNFWIQQIPPLTDLHSTEHNLFPLALDTPNVPKDLLSLSVRDKMMKHSSTINSIASPAGQPTADLAKRVFSNKKSQDGAAVLLDLLSQSDNQLIVPTNIWFTSSADLPWLSRLDTTLLTNVRLFDCPCLAEVKTGMQAIIGRIQKFCNSNSASPTTTRIGVLGGDKLVSQVLRAYVDLLQNKTCQDWLNYLRFSLVVPPSSAIGRLLAQITDGGYSEILWKRLSQVSSNTEALSASDHLEVDVCLSSVNSSLPGSQQKSVNLFVGEVMLQLENGMVVHPMDTEKDNSQIFVPFLSELHLGNLEECSSPLYYMKSSLDEGNNGQPVPPVYNNTTPLPSSHSQSFPTFPTGNLSPPVSPHSQKNSDGRELHVEYWTCASGGVQQSTAPNTTTYTYQEQIGQHSSSFKSSASGTGTHNPSGSRFSIKASVRTLSVAREPTTNLLCILFVKDKKKDKVLQKLGRKNKQRSSNDFANSHSRIVSSVSRMVCSRGSSSSSNKNQCFLDVLIDGNRWKRIRYFQIQSLWQTHVKLFPISFPLISGIATLNKSDNKF